MSNLKSRSRSRSNQRKALKEECPGFGFKSQTDLGFGIQISKSPGIQDSNFRGTGIEDSNSNFKILGLQIGGGATARLIFESQK